MFNNQKLGCKVENPIIQILVKHLAVEAEIFKAKNDIYSLNWAILALIGVDKEKDSILEESIKALEKESEKILGEVFDLTTELIIKFALGVRILKSENRDNSLITKAMKNLLERSKDKNWFNSQETVSMLLFLLNDENEFKLELNDACNWLHKKYNHFIEEKNYQNAIDSSFGLSFCRNVGLPSEEIIKIVDTQSIERISKFLIYLCRNQENEYLEDVVSLLENRLNNKFSDWIFPNLEMSLFEGINLAKTNLPKEDIKAIMDNFHKNKVEWVKFIDVSENGLLLKNIREIPKMPTFNVKEDTLSLLALLEADRKKVYQLNEEEYKSMSKAIRERKEGYTGIKECNLKNLFYFSLTLMAASFILALAFYALNGFQSIMSLYQIEFSLSPKNIVILLKSGSSAILMVIFALFVVFYYRIFHRLLVEGEITSKKELILLFPGIKEVYSMIKGGKPNDD
nr:hypothetical membrane protein [uncultured archaeon]